MNRGIIWLGATHGWAAATRPNDISPGRLNAPRVLRSLSSAPQRHCTMRLPVVSAAATAAHAMREKRAAGGARHTRQGPSTSPRPGTRELLQHVPREQVEGERAPGKMSKVGQCGEARRGEGRGRREGTKSLAPMLVPPCPRARSPPCPSALLRAAADAQARAALLEERDEQPWGR